VSRQSRPTLKRDVTRWEVVGLSLNDVIGSGVYLLPAAAAALLGPASLWAVLLAGLAHGRHVAQERRIGGLPVAARDPNREVEQPIRDRCPRDRTAPPKDQPPREPRLLSDL
jgi:hypothetical protein